MKTIELLVPRMGEGIVEVSVVKWLKKEGDKFNIDEPLIEIATDKVDSEIPAPYSGKIYKILARNGDNIGVGKPLALLQISSKDFADIPILNTAFEPTNTSKKQITLQTDSIISNKIKKYNENFEEDKDINSLNFKNIQSRLSPLVTKIARDNYLNSEDINKIYGTGIDGKITKTDILDYIERRPARFAIPDSLYKSQYKSEVNFNFNLTLSKGDKEIPLDRIRKMTAEKMSFSNRTIPHVTSFVEADVTELTKWRNEIKVAFKDKHNVPITYTPFFLWAISKALEDFPLINAYFANDVLIQKKEINLGLAVLIEENNLILPVIKSANQYSVKELATKVLEITQKARNKLLTPEDITGATYSVSNIGMFDTIFATPMINPPQVAIMAIGTAKKTLEYDEKTQKISNLYKVYLCHSYDHRVIDGAMGSMFATRVAKYLGNFEKFEI